MGVDCLGGFSMQHKRHGDLERFLGAKYAKDLENNPELLEVYHQADDILFNTMDVMSMMNKFNMNIVGQPQRQAS